MDVKMYCSTNQFPESNFVEPHNKRNGVHGLSNPYHMCFYTKLIHDRYSIHFITCDCTSFTYSLDQHRITGFIEQQQPRYQPIKYFTYWPVLCYFNNWNIIKLSHKETSGVELDKIYQAVLDGIIENTVALVQYG